MRERPCGSLFKGIETPTPQSPPQSPQAAAEPLLVQTSGEGAGRVGTAQQMFALGVSNAACEPLAEVAARARAELREATTALGARCELEPPSGQAAARSSRRHCRARQ